MKEPVRTPIALVVSLFLLVVAAASAPAAGDQLRGTWVGTYFLRGPGRIALTINGNRAVVALGTGHAGPQTLPLQRTATSFRPAIPGGPSAIVLEGGVRSRSLSGTARQGARGTFTATRGSTAALTLP